MAPCPPVWPVGEGCAYCCAASSLNFVLPSSLRSTRTTLPCPLWNSLLALLDALARERGRAEEVARCRRRGSSARRTRSACRRLELRGRDLGERRDRVRVARTRPPPSPLRVGTGVGRGRGGRGRGLARRRRWSWAARSSWWCSSLPAGGRIASTGRNRSSAVLPTKSMARWRSSTPGRSMTMSSPCGVISGSRRAEAVDAVADRGRPRPSSEVG